MQLDLDRLTGPQKAAIFVLGMEEEVAREVLRHLGNDELRDLTEIVDKLPSVPPEALESVCSEFAKLMRSPIIGGSQGDYVKKLVTAAVGLERSQQVYDPGPMRPAAMEALRAAHVPTLADLIRDEHPQIAAVVLSQLNEDKAAQVVAELPEAQQTDLVRRLLAIQEVPLQQVAMISDALAQALEAAGGVAELDHRMEFDGMKFAATILNELPPESTERILEVLDTDGEGELGSKIREAMFTFEDLGRVGVRDLQQVMREIDNETLLIALKTADEELREKLLSGVSARAAQQILAELPQLPPTRLSDVERAQREAVECALRLADQGKITLPGAGGEELV